MDVVGTLILQVHRLLPADLAGAEDLLERLSPIASGRRDYIIAEAHICVERGDVSAANRLASAAIDPSEPDADALLLLARIASIRHGPTAGAYACRAALIADPANPAAYNNLANRLIDIDGPSAKRLLERALTLAPDIAEAHVNLAVLAERAGNPAAAKRHSLAALRIAPDSAKARICLAKAIGVEAWTPYTQELLATALMLEPANALALNALGVNALTARDLSATEGWFRRALTVQPLYADALFNLGAFHQSVGRPEEALALYERMPSPTAPSLYNSALHQIEKKEYRAAISKLLEAARLRPHDQIIYAPLSHALFEIGKHILSEKIQQFAIQLRPEEPQQYYNLGVLLHTRDQFEESFRIYGRALQLDPTLAAAYANIAYCKIHLGLYPEAIAFGQHAIAYDPTVGMSYLNLGTAYQWNGDKPQALRWFDAALRMKPEGVDTLISVGLNLDVQDDAPKAMRFLRNAIATAPANPKALFSLGNLHFKSGENPQATAWFKRAASVDPHYILALNNLGTVHITDGRVGEAIAMYRRLIEVDPANAMGWYNLSIAHHLRDAFDSAVVAGKRCVALDPQSIDAQNNLAASLNLAGRVEEALACYQQALDHVKPSAAFLTNLANFHHRQGNTAEAISNYQAALRADPSYAMAHYHLGCVRIQAEEYAAAADSFKSALKGRPDHLSSLYNLACATHHQDKFEEAGAYYRQVLERDPQHVRAANNYASTLQSIGMQKAALSWYGRAQHSARLLGLTEEVREGEVSGPDADFADEVAGVVEAQERALNPAKPTPPQAGNAPMFSAAAWNKGLLLLSLGSLKEGWDGYEYRWHSNVMGDGAMRSLRQRMWDGFADLSGKRLLVWREQGIGDEIMFASCIPDIARTRARVMFECSKKLLPLFQRSFPNVEVVPQNRDGDTTRDDLDLHIPMGSLPRIYRQDIGQFPRKANFLVPDLEKRAYWRARLEGMGPPPYIGICWRGRVRTTSRNHHYTRIEDWGPILQGRQGTFINMQYDEASEEAAFAQEMFGTRIHTIRDIDMWDGLDDVAALLAAQDMLITAGTAVMSLAGALGVPTWLMWVDNVENWPTLGTDHLPWYPNIELFPRTLMQDWGQVTARIGARLDHILPDMASFIAGKIKPDYGN